MPSMVSRLTAKVDSPITLKCPSAATTPRPAITSRITIASTSTTVTTERYTMNKLIRMTSIVIAVTSRRLVSPARC